RGLMNLRGQIVPGIDLRRRLGLPDRDRDRDRAASADRPGMTVIVQGHHGEVGLLVDEVGEVLEVAEDPSEAPPESLAPAIRDVVQSATMLDGTLLLVLDAEKTVDLRSALEAGTGPCP